MKDGKITFKLEDTNEEVEFFVIEQTTFNETNYLLVADSEEDEAEALILKEVLTEGDEVVYDVVEDDDELDYVSSLFEAILEDFDIER